MSEFDIIDEFSVLMTMTSTIFFLFNVSLYFNKVTDYYAVDFLITISFCDIIAQFSISGLIFRAADEFVFIQSSAFEHLLHA